MSKEIQEISSLRKTADIDMEEDIMATANEASCGPRTIWTPSLLPREVEGEVEPKASAEERIQKVAMDKFCDADFATQMSISKQSALEIATEAEAQAEAHQRLSLDWHISRRQANSRRAPVEAIVLKLAHTTPPM